ncbi:MAG: hypothetical protein KC478_12365 [Bacteriovoracaceae bacterium]|nr:hypothetical protein [Bacteriovoracaceae bacterium]
MTVLISKNLDRFISYGRQLTEEQMDHERDLHEALEAVRLSAFKTLKLKLRLLDEQGINSEGDFEGLTSGDMQFIASDLKYFLNASGRSSDFPYAICKALRREKISAACYLKNVLSFCEEVCKNRIFESKKLTF